MLRGSLAVGLAAGLRSLPTRAIEPSSTRLLNASFDISRELFQALNPAFIQTWKARTGHTIEVLQSHGGSPKQARAVIDGLAADVVTLNQEPDVDALAARRGLVASNWRERFAHRASPYSSTIVFLVRRGNPKGIRDWPDLARPGISVVIPNPKASGNGRYGYLAAYAFALHKLNLNADEANEFVGRVFRNAPVLDTGGRAATTTFAQRGVGDVLVTFESEALLTLTEGVGADLELVAPSYSIEADMPVAVVDPVVQRKGTADAARAYLEFLYTEPAQEIIARHHFRPRLEAVARRHADHFRALELFRVETIFGSWDAAQKTHFAEGGVFDRVTRK